MDGDAGLYELVFERVADDAALADDAGLLVLAALELPATIWEVVRRERSVVEVRKATDPVLRHLDDARALARTQELPPDVKAVVVPGFCRSAIEAACHEAVRRRRLGAGQRAADVEDALRAARTTNQMVALALFDDGERGGDVLPRLNAIGRWAADVYQASRTGGHSAYTGELTELVRDTDRLAERLRR